MDKKYTITLNQEQLMTLEHMTDIMSRMICGQLDTFFDMYGDEAFHKAKDDGRNIPFEDWHKMQKKLRSLYKEIEALCWGTKDGEYNGIGYSNLSDELYDMYQVLRKFRYDHIFSDKDREIMKLSAMSDSPRQISEEPLIEVKEVTDLTETK